jgi:zinc protease
MSPQRPANWKSLPGSEDTTRVQLPNGITVLARANFASPSVVMSGYLPAGSLFEPVEKLGLAHFTSLALMRGTQQRSFQQIFDSLESAGASMGFGASVHNTSFGGRALAEDLPLLLATLTEVMRQPAFPAEHVERLRGQMLTSLSIRDQDTADRAELVFEDIVFPNHPYGRPTDGHPDTIRRITRADIIDYHRRCFGPSGMKLVVVGAVEPQRAVDLVAGALGDWQNPDQPTAPVMPALRPLDQMERRHIALAGKVQTDLLMGGLGPRRSDSEYLAASLGNNILGQFGLMGRIGSVVRERAGLAYQASTSLNAWIEGGSWEISAGVSPANLDQAIELIFSEIRRFISEPVSAEELSDSQAHYIGRLPLSLESNSGVASALLNLERFNLGLDYYRRYPAMVEAITVETILEAGRKWLNPAQFAVVSSGPEIQHGAAKRD